MRRSGKISIDLMYTELQREAHRLGTTTQELARAILNDYLSGKGIICNDSNKRDVSTMLERSEHRQALSVLAESD